MLVLLKMLPSVVMLLFGLLGAEAANILSIFPFTGKSHYSLFRPFVFNLAARGHHLTVITHFPDENPPENVTFVDIREPVNNLLVGALDIKPLEDAMGIWSGTRSLSTLAILYDLSVTGCENGLAHPNLQAFLKKPNKFDLVIVEFFNTDCFASLAHLYQAPIVGIFSSVALPWHNARFANPDNPAYIPNHMLQLPSQMNLFERVRNTIMYVVTFLAYQLIFNPTADAIVAKHLGPNIPPVRDIVNNASLFLVYSHFTLFQARPFVPSIIELGGLHVTPAVTSNIPHDILRFIESAEDGVVLFSMGSTMKGTTLNPDKVRMIKNVLGRLKQKVLWKWEEDIEDKPDNVLVSKWIPQNDILGHKNIKVFITHSGLMGSQEAIYHGVPMLMMPFFGDQPMNAAFFQEKGIGILVDYFTLTEEIFGNALDRLLHDPIYMKKSKEFSEVFKDRPADLMETAIYWTEYVLRHRGAPDLRSAATQLAWYQYLLLDVLLIILLSMYFSYKLTQFIYRLLWSKPEPKFKTH